MLKEEAMKLYKNNILKKGCKIKMGALKGFENFTKIDDVFIKKARFLEVEDDWLVIIINGNVYDAMWIDEIET
jgi:hypothetical protein